MSLPAAAGELGVLYLVGVDPARDVDDPDLARRALEAVPTVIVQELVENATTRYADVVLPAAAPQERTGSFTTWEGRRQPFPQAVAAQGLAVEDWDICRQLARALGDDLGWESAMDVRREAAALMAPATPFNARLSQVTVPRTAPPVAAEEGVLALHAVDWLLGQGDLLAGADELRATARAPRALLHPAEAERLGIADGAPVVLRGERGRIELPAHVTEHVVEGCVVVPANSTEVTPAELGPEVGADGVARVQVASAEPAAVSADDTGEAGA